MRIQDHFSISVNLDVGHGHRAGLSPSDTVVYISFFDRKHDDHLTENLVSDLKKLLRMENFD